jgi:SpoVK/Ycf46/Vps4 family AAA+-type ATPase
VTYADIGGSDMQKQEIREAVELPLTHFDLYKQVLPALPCFSQLAACFQGRFPAVRSAPLL